MEHDDSRSTAPWVWMVVTLGAIMLILVVWWAVAAQSDRQVVVTPEERAPQPSVQPPAEQQPYPEQQPRVIERERPVNIYIEREERQPSVIIVPRGENPPEARERLRQVDLPATFSYQGRTWEPSNTAVSGDEVDLLDTGASVDGNIVYAQRGDTPPYDHIYLETEPGSGIYIRYDPR